MCTSIEQSKKLLELGLSPKTADMFYMAGKGEPLVIGDKLLAIGSDDYDAIGGPDVVAWSLSSLLELMPKRIWCGITDYAFGIGTTEDEWHAQYTERYAIVYKRAGNLLEASYDMMVWLLENNYIKKEK